MSSLKKSLTPQWLKFISIILDVSQKTLAVLGYIKGVFKQLCLGWPGEAHAMFYLFTTSQLKLVSFKSIYCYATNILVSVRTDANAPVAFR